MYIFSGLLLAFCLGYYLGNKAKRIEKPIKKECHCDNCEDMRTSQMN